MGYAMTFDGREELINPVSGMESGFYSSSAEIYTKKIKNAL